MNPQVTIESQSIKDSLKRNAIGKAVVSIVLFTVVYYSFTSSLISCMFAIITVMVLALLMVIYDYFISISIIIDKGVLALLRRRKK
jgi:preprotein translocase subunit SecD